MWALRYLEEGKLVKRKCCIHNVFRAKEEGGVFHTLFGRLKDNGQNILKNFRKGMSKFEIFKVLLCTDKQTKNTE